MRPEHPGKLFSQRTSQGGVEDGPKRPIVLFLAVTLLFTCAEASSAFADYVHCIGTCNGQFRDCQNAIPQPLIKDRIGICQSQQLSCRKACMATYHVQGCSPYGDC